MEKTYLNCVVTRQDGSIFSNPLQTKEAHLITQLAKENQCVNVTAAKTTKEYFKFLFG